MQFYRVFQSYPVICSLHILYIKVKQKCHINICYQKYYDIFWLLLNENIPKLLILCAVVMHVHYRSFRILFFFCYNSLTMHTMTYVYTTFFPYLF